MTERTRLNSSSRHIYISGRLALTVGVDVPSRHPPNGAKSNQRGRVLLRVLSQERDEALAAWNFLLSEVGAAPCSRSGGGIAFRVDENLTWIQFDSPVLYANRRSHNQS